MEGQFYQEISHIIPSDQIKYKERMDLHTSLHIGGEADYYVTPTSEDEVKALILLCREKNIPYYIIGNGSNLLVSDKGYRGVILRLGERFSKITIREDGTVTAQAGVLLSKLANEIARQSLTGFEFAAGIPGSLGGAVTMNAGAYDGDMKSCMISARVMNSEGEIKELNKEELELDYRSSILQKMDYIVLDATMRFEKGDHQQIVKKMQELNSLRREKQPLDQYSVGSTFKRPTGYFAAKLICDAGLRGYQIGGAQVSEKHCGFLINKDQSTAKDFMTLIQEVRRTVEEKFSVKLEPEVKFLGDFTNG